MPSLSLIRWRTERQQRLNEIESAHARVEGTARGRRYATLQINHAYAVLLSSEFQGYCRELHGETADALVRGIGPNSLQSIVRLSLTQDRKLDRGNPNPGNIGSDFGRLGVKFWDNVKIIDTRGERRLELLEELNGWRNAIAHQDFTPANLSGRSTTLGIQDVRQWRSATRGLAETFDKVMFQYISSVTGNPPW